jgi:geranylgeranyl reductase family protein
MSALDMEVLVVGGGPAGSATASLLARQGHDVLLLDRAAFPREKACAEYFSPGVVDVAGRLGLRDAIQAAEPVRPLGMRIRTERSSVHLAYIDGRLDPDSSDDRTTQRSGLGMPRPRFDNLLLDHARACGVRVRERVFVSGALVEAGQVVGVRARSGSREESLHARVVVAADGLQSTIVRSLGLARPVRWPQRLGLIARYAGVTAIDRYGEMHVGRGGYCGLAPVGEGLVNVGLVGPLGGLQVGEPIEQLFERRLAQLPGALQALRGAERVTPVRGVGPMARRVRRVAGPGYLLVGDAAGFLDPFTGEGVYRALRGAELAAAAVGRALQRSDAMPVGYTQARHAAFADKEWVCWLIQLFLASPRWFGYAIGNLSRRPALAAVLAGVLGDYHPARAALRPAYLAALLRP